jgi:predicted kinase
MSKIIFLKGLPASGKSTWAREFVSKNRNWIRLNKDDLRNMLHDGVYTKENENRVFNFRNQLLHAAMMDGLNIIIDDTNFNPYHEKLLKEVAEEYKAEFEVKFFDVPLEECLRRNSQRVGKAKVPDEVIVDMYNKYLKKEV